MSKLIRNDFLRNFFRSTNPLELASPIISPYSLLPKYPLMDLKNMDVEIKENKEAFTLEAEIPGVNKEDISVTIDGNQVTIKAEIKKENEEKKDEKVLYNERYYGQFMRSFTLEQPIDESKSNAHYENGVLTLTLPKKKGLTTKQLNIS